MKENGYKLGVLENRFKFTNVKDGREVEAISTPAAYMLADEWVDAISAKTEHSPIWRMTYLGHAIAVLTMREQGLVKFHLPMKLEHIATALNEWDYDLVESYEPTEAAADPLATAQDGGQAPAEGE